MKRKKVMTITALVFTCATIASCGKTTETVNAEPVIQATEQIVLETEEITQVSADQGEGDAITLEPTMDESGNLIYPTYEEKYVTYTHIEPVDLYCIEKASTFSNPNMTEGKLVKYGEFEANSCHTYDVTCEIEGDTYYGFTNSKTNQVLIVSADRLSETAPEGTNSSASSSSVPGTEFDPSLLPEEWKDIPYEETTDERIEELADQVPDEVWDQAEGMIFE